MTIPARPHVSPVPHPEAFAIGIAGFFLVTVVVLAVREWRIHRRYPSVEQIVKAGLLALLLCFVVRTIYAS